MASAIEALVANSKPGEAFKGAGSAVGDAFLKARDLAQEEEKIRMMKAEAEAKKNYYDQQADQALFDGLKDASSIKDRKIRKLNLDVWAKRYEKMKGEPVSKDFLEVINTTDEGYNRAISRYFGEVQGLPFEQQAQAKASLMKGLPAYDALQFSQDIKPFEDSNYQQWKTQREESTKLKIEQMKNQRAEQSKKNNFSTEILKSAVGAGAEISPEAAKRFSEGTQTPEDIANLSKSRQQVQTNKEKREFESKNLAEILKNPKVPAWVKQGLQNEATPAEYKSQLMLMANDEIYNADKQKSDLDIQGKSTDIKAKESQMGINQEKLVLDKDKAALEKDKFAFDKTYKNKLTQIREEGQKTRSGQSEKRLYNTAVNQVSNHAPVRDGMKTIGQAENDLALLNKEKVTILEAKEAIAGLTRLVQGVGAIPEGREAGISNSVLPQITQWKTVFDRYKGDLSKTYIEPETKKQLVEAISRIRDQTKKFVGVVAKRQIDQRTPKVFSEDDRKYLYSLYGISGGSGGSAQKFSPAQIQGMIQKGGKDKTLKYLKSKGYTDEELKGIK